MQHVCSRLDFNTIIIQDVTDSFFSLEILKTELVKLRQNCAIWRLLICRNKPISYILLETHESNQNFKFNFFADLFELN